MGKRVSPNSKRRERRQASAARRRARSIKQRKVSWRTAINVDREVGKKKYTSGQKDYMRALKVIEETLKIPAADIKLKYGSDDIEELADQYYSPELADYTEEELALLEKEFNKTHGYQVRIKKAVNPFAGIDFNTLRPN